MSDLIIGEYIIDEPIINIVTQVRLELGYTKLNSIEQRGDHVMITCPVHSGGNERNPSFGIYCGDDAKIQYGLCHCFTCGFSGPLWHFVGECFECDDEFGKQWLIDRYGKLVYKESIELEPIEMPIRATKQVKTIDESSLDKFQKFHPYMSKRKLNSKVCEMFKVRYDPKSECIVFPVWDERDRLVMFTRRSVMNKRFIIDANKEKPVYLLNYIRKEKIKEVTLVESQINCLTLWGWGYPSCALFGTGTKHQYDVLNKSDVEHYYLALDGDSAGDSGILKFIKNIKKSVFVDIIQIPRGEDVNELTQEEFESLPIISREDWLKNEEDKDARKDL